MYLLKLYTFIEDTFKTFVIFLNCQFYFETNTPGPKVFCTEKFYLVEMWSPNILIAVS